MEQIIKIEPGKHSPTFQFVRAMLSAAKASMYVDRKECLRCLDQAIKSLTELRLILTKEK